ncbi:hypothetical protein M2267_001876 [Ensifer sp. KUDG1]|uniref:hypothetical protein n=1 Tax=Ensifer sp. KUDG1 TaxID=3373919 RepID=UPI003D241E11
MKAELRRRVAIIVPLLALILFSWFYYLDDRACAPGDRQCVVNTFLALALGTVILGLTAIINLLILLGKILIHFQDRDRV